MGSFPSKHATVFQAQSDFCSWSHPTYTATLGSAHIKGTKGRTPPGIVRLQSWCLKPAQHSRTTRAPVTWNSGNRAPEWSTPVHPPHHFSRLLRYPWLEMAYSYPPWPIGISYNYYIQYAFLTWCSKLV